MTQTYTLTEAKAKLSELISRSILEGRIYDYLKGQSRRRSVTSD